MVLSVIALSYKLDRVITSIASKVSLSSIKILDVVITLTLDCKLAVILKILLLNKFVPAGCINFLTVS